MEFRSLRTVYPLEGMVVSVRKFENPVVPESGVVDRGVQARPSTIKKGVTVAGRVLTTENVTVFLPPLAWMVAELRLYNYVDSVKTEMLMDGVTKKGVAVEVLSEKNVLAIVGWLMRAMRIFYYEVPFAANATNAANSTYPALIVRATPSQSELVAERGNARRVRVVVRSDLLRICRHPSDSLPTLFDVVMDRMKMNLQAIQQSIHGVGNLVGNPTNDVEENDADNPADNPVDNPADNAAEGGDENEEFLM